MDTDTATVRLSLVRAPHKPVPTVTSLRADEPRCARDGVRIHRTKRRAWQHDRGEIGALAAIAEPGFPGPRKVT
jgi:hypothetical protein